MKLATSTTLRRRALGALAAVVAVPVALGVAPSAAIAAPAPTQTTDVEAAALPAGLSVQSITWMSDRMVRVLVNSPSMGGQIPFDLILPQTWFSDPTATFGSYILLDGFRVPDTASDWEREAQAQEFFKDKNVLAVTAVGGAGSFYSNWQQKDPNAGVQLNQQWGTFFQQEVPALLQSDFRGNGRKAVGGLSMGATAAMTYALRDPTAWKAAAAFSGYLHTTSPYMPDLIKYSISTNINFNPDNLWGADPTNATWADNDPFQLATKNAAAIKAAGTALYVSSGSGFAGQYDTPGAFGLSSNYVGSLLEIIANYSSQDFATQLNTLGVVNTENFRPNGTHSWPYWKDELANSWPTVAAALNTPASPSSVPCGVDGAFAGLVVPQALGACTSNVYRNAAGTLTQDFVNGRAYVNFDNQAFVVRGLIGAAYQQIGAEGAVGLPTNTEADTVRSPQGTDGKYNNFVKNGATTSIYFSQFGTFVVSPGTIQDQWAAAGFEGGRFGLPIGPKVNGAQPFQGGVILGT